MCKEKKTKWYKALIQWIASIILFFLLTESTYANYPGIQTMLLRHITLYSRVHQLQFISKEKDYTLFYSLLNNIYIGLLGDI